MMDDNNGDHNNNRFASSSILNHNNNNNNKIKPQFGTPPNHHHQMMAMSCRTGVSSLSASLDSVIGGGGNNDSIGGNNGNFNFNNHTHLNSHNHHNFNRNNFGGNTTTTTTTKSSPPLFANFLVSLQPSQIWWRTFPSSLARSPPSLISSSVASVSETVQLPLLQPLPQAVAKPTPTPTTGAINHNKKFNIDNGGGCGGGIRTDGTGGGSGTNYQNRFGGIGGGNGGSGPTRYNKNVNFTLRTPSGDGIGNGGGGGGSIGGGIGGIGGSIDNHRSISSIVHKFRDKSSSSSGAKGQRSTTTTTASDEWYDFNDLAAAVGDGDGDGQSKHGNRMFPEVVTSSSSSSSFPSSFSFSSSSSSSSLSNIIRYHQTGIEFINQNASNNPNNPNNVTTTTSSVPSVPTSFDIHPLTHTNIDGRFRKSWGNFINIYDDDGKQKCIIDRNELNNYMMLRNCCNDHDGGNGDDDHDAGNGDGHHHRPYRYYVSLFTGNYPKPLYSSRASWRMRYNVFVGGFDHRTMMVLDHFLTKSSSSEEEEEEEGDNNKDSGDGCGGGSEDEDEDGEEEEDQQDNITRMMLKNCKKFTQHQRHLPEPCANKLSLLSLETSTSSTLIDRNTEEEKILHLGELHVYFHVQRGHLEPLYQNICFFYDAHLAEWYHRHSGHSSAGQNRSQVQNQDKDQDSNQDKNQDKDFTSLIPEIRERLQNCAKDFCAQLSRPKFVRQLYLQLQPPQPKPSSDKADIVDTELRRRFCATDKRTLQLFVLRLQDLRAAIRIANDPIPFAFLHRPHLPSTTPSLMISSNTSRTTPSIDSVGGGGGDDDKRLKNYQQRQQSSLSPSTSSSSSSSVNNTSSLSSTIRSSSLSSLLEQQHQLTTTPFIVKNNNDDDTTTAGLGGDISSGGGGGGYQ